MHEQLIFLINFSENVFPRGNSAAKGRSGRTPTGRDGPVSARLFTHGKREHSEVQSHPPCNGRWTVIVVMRVRGYKLRVDWYLFDITSKIYCLLQSFSTAKRLEMNYLPKDFIKKA